MSVRDDQLEALLHRRAIEDLLAHYCDRLDAYDIDEVASTFAPGARTDYGPGRGGVVIGREAIRDRIASGQAAFRRTHHQLGHSTIAVDGMRATALTAALTWHERWSGEQELLALRYIDELALGDDAWLITSRRVEVSMVEGFEGTTWHWWPRQRPTDQPSGDQ